MKENASDKPAQLLTSGEIIHSFSLLRQAYLIFDIEDGDILGFNAAADEFLGCASLIGHSNGISKLVPGGFPRLEFFRHHCGAHQISQRISFFNPDKNSHRSRELNLSGHCLPCSDKTLFFITIEDISPAAEFDHFLLELSSKNSTLSFNPRLLIEFSLEYLRRITGAQCCAAFFPEFYGDPIYMPQEISGHHLQHLSDVLKTFGKTGERNEGGLSTIDLEDEAIHMLHLAPAVYGIQQGSLVLLNEGRKPFSENVVKPVQNVSQLLVAQLIRNQAQRSISLNTSELERIRDNTQLGIAFTDMYGCIAHNNNMLSQMLGINTADLIGRSLEQIPGLIRIPEEQEKMRLIPVMYSHRRPDKQMIFLNITELALQGEHGFQTMLLFWDVSSIRNLEDEMMLARNQAESAETSKSNFISNISHELRTPLNGINGMAQLLEDLGLDEGQKEILDTLRMAVANLNNLIQDLLDFSRLDAGKVIIEEDYFSVRKLLHQVMMNHQAQADSKGLTIHLSIDDQGLEYYGDAMRYQQIVNNLLSNAIKFTDKGNIRLTAVFSDGLLLTSVEDSGIGIPKKLQRQIFGSFTQLEHTYTKYRQGLGLGLAITLRLTELMQGSIDLESEAGKGSTFTLSLPAGSERLRSQIKGETPDKSNAPVQDIFPGLRVLVAEDDFLNRKTMVEFLKRQGCFISAAKNGLEAEHLLRTIDFDILIFDITMPELSGNELTRLVRKKHIHYNPDVPILGVTAHVYPGEIQSFLDEGMDDILTKPFVASQLYEKMKNVMSIRST